MENLTVKVLPTFAFGVLTALLEERAVAAEGLKRQVHRLSG